MLVPDRLHLIVHKVKDSPVSRLDLKSEIPVIDLLDHVRRHVLGFILNVEDFGVPAVEVVLGAGVSMLVLEILACGDMDVFAVCVVGAVILVQLVVEALVEGDRLDFGFEDVGGAYLETEFDMAFGGVSVDVCVGDFGEINPVVEGDVVNDEADGCGQDPKNIETNDDSSNKPLCISSRNSSHIQLSKHKQTLLSTRIMEYPNSSRQQHRQPYKQHNSHSRRFIMRLLIPALKNLREMVLIMRPLFP